MCFSRAWAEIQNMKKSHEVTCLCLQCFMVFHGTPNVEMLLKKFHGSFAAALWNTLTELNSMTFYRSLCSSEFGQSTQNMPLNSVWKLICIYVYIYYNAKNYSGTSWASKLRNWNDMRCLPTSGNVFSLQFSVKWQQNCHQFMLQINNTAQDYL